MSITYKSFNMRCGLLNSLINKENINDSESLQRYIESFDNLLESINWSENDLLDFIDSNW